MRILVTGGAGFIASHIVDALLADGHDVAVADDLSTGRVENLNPDARFYRVDIADYAALAGVFAKERPELVNHHAAQVDVRRSMSEPVHDATVNIIGSLNVLRLCVEMETERLLFASTCAVYSEPQYLPMDETHPIAPQSGYGVAKLAVEGYVRLQSHAHGLKHKVFRYGNVYGPRQNPKGEAGVVAIFGGQMLAGARPIIFGDGGKTRDYVFVGDIVRANLMAMGETGDGQVFNLAGDAEVSDLEMFDAVRGAVGSDVEPAHAPKRPGEADRVRLGCAKALEALGWEAQVPLSDGILQTMDYLRAQDTP